MLLQEKDNIHISSFIFWHKQTILVGRMDSGVMVCRDCPQVQTISDLMI